LIPLLSLLDPSSSLNPQITSVFFNHLVQLVIHTLLCDVFQLAAS